MSLSSSPLVCYPKKNFGLVHVAVSVALSCAMMGYSARAWAQSNQASTSAAKPAPQGASTITKITFLGNQAYSNEAITALVESYIGKPSNTETINEMTEKIRSFYQDNGFLVTQIINVSQNPALLDLRIFEGYIDKTTVVNKSNYPIEDLQKYAIRALCGTVDHCEGFPLLNENLERAVGILSDLPGLAPARAQISPGGKVGTSDIEMFANKGDDYTAYVAYDNYGAKSTGVDRVTLGLVGNNWAGIGDQLVLETSLTQEKDNFSGQINYSIPMGYDGWRLGASLARSQYSLADVFESLESKGRTHSFSLYASYPLIRTSQHNLSFRGSVDFSESKTFLLSKQNPKSTGRGVTLGINGRWNDRAFLGSSFSTYGTSYIYGHSEVDASATSAASTSNSDRLTYNFSRDQELLRVGETGRISLYLAARGQEANNTLCGCERLSLGGPNGVRAYPSGEQYGDRGVIGNVELRYGFLLQPLLPGFLSVAVFHDRGWKRNVEKDSTGSYLNKTLTGHGISLSLSVLDRWNLNMIYAKRAGNSPISTTEDNPKDHRWWINGSVSF